MKKTFTITADKAKSLYPSASAELKKDLENTFGVKFLSEDITDRIKTFNDACIECGTTKKEFNKKWGNLGLSDDDIAYKQAKIIRTALNGKDYKPDWNDKNEKKWYPVFKMGSGFGFSCSLFVDRGTSANAGSRLCFKNEKLATHAGKQFPHIYKLLLTE